MCFTNINILKCNEGDILASDIYSVNGTNLLVAKEAVMNDYIMKRLISLGISSVCIYKEDEMDLLHDKDEKRFLQGYKKKVELTKNIFHGMISGEPLNYSKLQSLIELIYGDIHENKKILKFVSKLRAKDEYIYMHSINVAFYSMLIAKGLRLSEEGIYKAILSGLLHDIGKTKIPDHILRKPGRLSREEFEIIKKHPDIGYDIVENMKGINDDVKKAILQHHERMDGSGYPFGYLGKHINLYSRIVAVADVFDAMTTDRVYQGKSTPFQVINMFLTEGITLFDVRIVDVFVKHLVNYLIGNHVLLDNGETGEIVFIPQYLPYCPIIKVSGDFVDLSKDNTKKIIKML